MYCTNCGSKFSSEDVFCSGCGAKQDGNSSDMPSNTSSNIDMGNLIVQGKPLDFSFGDVLIQFVIIAVVSVLFILVGAGVAWLIGNINLSDHVDPNFYIRIQSSHRPDLRGIGINPDYIEFLDIVISAIGAIILWGTRILGILGGIIALFISVSSSYDNSKTRIFVHEHGVFGVAHSELIKKIENNNSYKSATSFQLEFSEIKSVNTEATDTIKIKGIDREFTITLKNSKDVKDAIKKEMDKFVRVWPEGEKVKNPNCNQRINAIKDILCSSVNPYKGSLFFHGDKLSKSKLSNAKTSFYKKISTSEQLIIFGDFTTNRSAMDGFALTDDVFYYKNSGAAAGYICVSDIGKMSINGTELSIFLDNDSTEPSEIVIHFTFEDIFDVLNNVVNILKN